MSDKEYIYCPKCDTTFKIPATNNVLRITCRDCGTIFYKGNPESAKNKKNNKFIITVSIIGFLIILWLINNPIQTGNSIVPKFRPSNWVKIDYSALVNTSIITHNGETVGQIIEKIPKYNDDLKGLVQGYLEPYSVLCHDVLLSTIKPDTLPLVNILSHYPLGTEQPAWVALFREGHYQLYYNNNLIRVFLKGSNPTKSFYRYQSIIRHPIRDILYSNNAIQNILFSDNTVIDSLEVYVFNNDYGTREIELNTIPEVFSINTIDLSSYREPIDLSSIEEFLKQKVGLEAIEVDERNNLYFYGVKDETQTIAGSPVSLSDIAVIYRSIFHYGFNAPYISLDSHEDNRYAKVNFGGHLEDTHAGHVVLEADKLFKALSTGLDPNTHKLIKDKITKKIPEFLTQYERDLLEDSNEEYKKIRYWFYPDSIGTVTDGSIGAVLDHQFLADVERMDKKVNAGNAVRKTIAHLNRNFKQYEKVDKTFQELSTVGRIMALINWLKGMNMDQKIELDELLSVKIPAFTTPDKTKKMLAITTACYPKNTSNFAVAGFVNPSLTHQSIRKYTKVYYVSDLLDKYSANTSDKYFLDVAMDYFSDLDIKELAPAEYVELRNSFELMEKKIVKKKSTLNRNNSDEVYYYNQLVNQKNSLATKINEMGLETRAISSIGGGINLRPSEFKRISRKNNSPRIREISKIKSKMKVTNKISKSGKWIRNEPGIYKNNKTNTIPINNWTSSKSINGKINYSHQSISGDKAVTTLSKESGDWSSSTFINDFQDVIHFKKSSNQLSVTHPILQKECIGSISESGKRITFY